MAAVAPTDLDTTTAGEPSALRRALSVVSQLPIASTSILLLVAGMKGAVVRAMTAMRLKQVRMVSAAAS